MLRLSPAKAKILLILILTVPVHFSPVGGWFSRIARFQLGARLNTY